MCTKSWTGKEPESTPTVVRGHFNHIAKYVYGLYSNHNRIIKKFHSIATRRFRISTVQRQSHLTLAMATEVEDVMKRIRSHRGVKHLIVMNKEGLPLKMSMEVNPTTEQQVKNIHELSVAARRMVRDMDPTDDLLFLRTQSDTDELLVSPDTDFTVVVIQSTKS